MEGKAIDPKHPDSFHHISVLKEECLAFLCPSAFEMENKEAIYADLTFGGGGHSFALLQKMPKIVLWAVDQDPDAIFYGKKRMASSSDQSRIELWHMNFHEFPKYVQKEKQAIFNRYGGLNGILLDLGVSSHQFDQVERGFSLRADAPLDMRMDYKNPNIPTASEIVNSLSAEDLEQIFSIYGEERYARRVATKIVEKREHSPILTTLQLEDIIFHAYPAAQRHGRIHPATRCFQALRIYVNDELRVLEDVLPQLSQMLTTGGRMAVISFHSLEDRIVKRSFKKLCNNLVNDNSGQDAAFKTLTKKPVCASAEEIHVNSRARSAKLRVIEKI